MAEWLIGAPSPTGAKHPEHMPYKPPTKYIPWEIPIINIREIGKWAKWHDLVKPLFRIGS